MQLAYTLSLPQSTAAFSAEKKYLLETNSVMTSRCLRGSHFGLLRLGGGKCDLTHLIASITVTAITFLIRGTAFEHEPPQISKVFGSDKA